MAAANEVKQNSSGSWTRRMCCSILQTGHIPRHIAIIMDGNRRFAKKMRQEKLIGHSLGFDKLIETLEWCLDLGVAEMTVYAFSIENFKRSQDEVDYLMELAKQKVSRLLEERDLLDRHGVCIRVLGDLTRLPRDVQEAVARAMKLTRIHNKVYLNVCFSYTSQQEITEAIQGLARGASDNMILPSDVSEELLERCLYTSDSPPPDLLIRTSGEVRLSDFLLWQNSYSCLCFQDVLWPEFSLWNLFSAVIMYQRNFSQIQEAREYTKLQRAKKQYQSDYQCVSEMLEESAATKEAMNEDEISKRVEEYSSQRRKRTEEFVQYLRNERLKLIDDMCPNLLV